MDTFKNHNQVILWQVLSKMGPYIPCASIYRFRYSAAQNSGWLLGVHRPFIYLFESWVINSIFSKYYSWLFNIICTYSTIIRYSSTVDGSLNVTDFEILILGLSMEWFWQDMHFINSHLKSFVTIIAKIFENVDFFKFLQFL